MLALCSLIVSGPQSPPGYRIGKSLISQFGPQSAKNTQRTYFMVQSGLQRVENRRNIPRAVGIKEGTESRFLNQLEEMIQRQTQTDKLAALALAKGADAAAVAAMLRT